MKRKVLAALLAAAMAGTLLAGCGTPGSKDKGETAMRKYSAILREQSLQLWIRQRQIVFLTTNFNMRSQKDL